MSAYRERLWPGPGTWLAGAGIGVSFGVVALPLGRTPGLVAGAAGVVIVTVLLVRAAAPIEVRDGELRAGPARLPLAVVTGALPLDATRMRHERSVGLDARAFLCLRGWVQGGVRVEMSDPDDPAPYWLLSSRHPQRLAEVLEHARAK